MAGLRIEVDGERCTGHGRCYTLAPELYEPDDDGYCATRSLEVRAGFEEEARVGARNCPEHAITLVEG